MESQLLTVALQAARAAAEVHEQHAGEVRPDQWSWKGSADFVTFVDREAEARIEATIHAAFPTHAIMGEEGVGDSGAALGDAWREREWLWIVDPLDGTTNYLHSYPMYAASVAVAQRGELVAAAVVCTPTGDTWTARRGGGAFLNGERIGVSTIAEMQPALIGTGFPFKNLDLMPGYLRQFDAVMRASSGVRRAGSAALDLCHVATGWFDGFWELDLYPWDYAAGGLLIREAGGLITSLAGELNLFERGGVIAGNPAIHGALSTLLREHGL